MDDSWGDEDIPGLDLEFDDEFGNPLYVSDLDLARQRAREQFLKNIIGGGEEEEEMGDEEDLAFETCVQPEDLWIEDEDVGNTEDDEYVTCLQPEDLWEQPQFQPQQPCPQYDYGDPCRDYYTLEMDFDEDDICGNLSEEEEPEKECKVNITRAGKVIGVEDVVDETRECQNNYIVDDQYYPGLIDDAVHKKINFYQTAFDLSFGENNVPDDPPDNPPLSLVEAFEMRVAREQGARKKIMKEVAPRQSAVPVQADKPGFIGFLKDQRRINRDEVKLANVAHLELATIVQNKPLNELTKAINCLQKAQLMNEYDKSLQAAEEAYQSAPPELAESAAVQKATNFITEELTRKKTTVNTGSRSYRPIEIVSYVGITKPILEEPELAAARCK